MKRFKMIPRARMAKIEQTLARTNKRAKAACKALLGHNQYPTFRETLYVNEPVRGLDDKVRGLIHEADKLRNEVTLSFMPLVKLKAGQVMIKYGLSEDARDDLVSQGWLILVRAFINYTNTKLPLHKYARSLLDKELKRFVAWNDTSRLTSRSSEYSTLAQKANKAEEQLMREGIMPTPEHVEEIVAGEVALQNAAEKVRNIQRLVISWSESDHLIADESLLVDPNLAGVQVEDELPESVDNLFEMVEITPRDRKLLMYRAAGVAAKDLAKAYNMSPQQVTDTLRQAWARIKRELSQREAA